MTEKSVLPWVAINNGVMDDVYRQQVVTDALNYCPLASTGLRKYALDIFKKEIQVRGFRSFTNIPSHIVKPHVISEFKTNANLAAAIICLWAEKQSKIIETLKNAARESNIPVHKKWSWQEARHGYVAAADIPDLNQLATTLAAQKTKPESDHFLLASLWLSSSVLVEEPESESNEVNSVPQLGSRENEISILVESANEAMPKAPPPVTVSEDIPVTESTLDTAELDRKSIKELSTYWELQSAHIIGSRDSVLAKIEELQATARKGELSETRERVKQLEINLEEWESLKEKSEELIGYITIKLSRELQLRSDIKNVQPEVSALSDEPTENELVAILPTIFQAIVTYDSKKLVALSEINSLQLEIEHLQQRLSLWEDTISPETDVTTIDDSTYSEGSIHELESIIGLSKRTKISLSSKLNQARELSTTRIKDANNKILEYKDKKPVFVVGYNIDEINKLKFSEIEDEELRNLEKGFAAYITQRKLSESSTHKSPKIAAALLQNLDENNFSKLLLSLATDQRDMEALLFFISVYSQKGEKISIPPQVARSLLNGISQLSNPGEPFELLSHICSHFFSGWQVDDPMIRAERCLLALATEYASTYGLPEGLLVQMEIEWPIESMKNWKKLWQAILQGENVEIFTDHKETELSLEIVKQKKNLESLLGRDGGHYIRLSSLQSNRHRTMIGNKLLPEIEHQFAKLVSLQADLQTATSFQYPTLLEKTRNQISILTGEYAEEQIEEKYERAAHEDGINDKMPFYSRISINILKDISSALLEFAAIILAFEDLKDARSKGFSSAELEVELSSMKNKSPLAETALSKIVEKRGKTKSINDEGAIIRLTDQAIAKTILSDINLVSRLPNVSTYLINNRIAWPDITKKILADIKSSLNSSEVANLLLDAGASNQVLMLVSAINLEQQKEAQAIQIEKEKQYNDFVTDYFQLGGDSEWLNQDHELGRWGLIIKQIQDEINLLRNKAEEEQRSFDARSFKFRVKINKLDELIFKSKTQMPVSVFTTIQRGLSAARRASESLNLFKSLQEYLEEIDYRLEHNSWPEREIEKVTENLERVIFGNQVDNNIKLDAEQLLEIFGTGDLSKLNLPHPDAITDSAINTRSNILECWIRIKKMRGFLAEDLPKSDADIVKSFFIYFARMIQMKRSQLNDGTVITDYENPLLHSSWELQYPRTAALTGTCFMVAIPGNPPSRDNLKVLDDFLEDQDFLDKDFVFLFIPGCTEGIAKRLSLNYARKKVVVIDENALVSMLLTEKSEKKPLWVLRPMMLNSTGANANIFDVKASVSARTSIFVGRDDLVGRIVSSGDNFALYGGRRIGKSSVLKAIEERLARKNVRVISYTLEGEQHLTESYVISKIAQIMDIKDELYDTGDLKLALKKHLEDNPEESIVILLDEVDRYILENPKRHTLIEALRATSDNFGNRFRVIIVGFMALYDCLRGRGPYTFTNATNDPWDRMFLDTGTGPLDNLRPSNAEEIVREGFESILGWEFEHRAIPQRIVQRTGGHPAFVQYFCLKIQELVVKRQDRKIAIKDVETVFEDQDPNNSFVAYVRKTLEHNLKGDPVSSYLIVWLASESSEAKSFTFDEIKDISETTRKNKKKIPEKLLRRSLELLTVTSVVRERSPRLYEFTVPDYPQILSRLGETEHLDRLEIELDNYLLEYKDAN